MGSLYAGVGPVLPGSAPAAAGFFATYETSKNFASKYDFNPFCSHMASAALGEVVACTVNVPKYVIKQRTQVYGGSSFSVLKSCLKSEGFMGLFKGFKCAVVRDIPFSSKQFSIYEELETRAKHHKSSDCLILSENGLCGLIASGIAGAVTIPFDVAKTRISLARKEHPESRGEVSKVLWKCVRKEGFPALFSGVLPRTVFLSVGGFLYLGVYEQVKNHLNTES